MPALRLLVIGDIHYAPGGPDVGRRRCALGLELLRRAIEDAKAAGGFDAIALMGDLLDDGTRDGSGEALLELRSQIDRAAEGTCVLAVPGNHDGPAEQFFSVFPSAPWHDVGPYRLVAFADRYGPGDVAERSEQDRDRLRDALSTAAGPVIALQHNPMNPPIADDYPYMLANRPQVMDDYAQGKVLLSLSGHYHGGQPLSIERGVSYFTAPALSEAPFQYALVELFGREVRVEVRRLSFDGSVPLVDCHAHTQFAYCGRGISAEMAVDRARLMGLSGLCLIEHAPQLYCSADDFWAARHIRQAGLWRSGPCRMGEYRRLTEALRGDFVRRGLEVELDAQGEITLRPEDRDWPDLLVGAIHWLRRDVGEFSTEELEREFMRTCEGLAAGGIDVLAHPFRLFSVFKRPTPTHLYGPLADLLAEHAVASEINFHINQPDEAFFALCIERGVKIAFGTDAHAPHEYSTLGPHLAMLRHIAGRQDVGDLLFRPA